MAGWIVEVKKKIGVHGKDVTAPRQAILIALSTYQDDPEPEDIKWSRLEVIPYPELDED